MKQEVSFKRKLYLEYLCLLLLFIIAIVVRLFHIKSAMVFKGTISFFQPDTYYHLRRTILYAHNFPSINSFDYYLAYPLGAECPWPPLYDWLIAVISLIINAGKVDNYLIEILHALFPILSAALAIFPVYYTSKLLLKSKAVSCLITFFFIFAPGLFTYSVFVSGDHHATEILLALCMLYYATKSLSRMADGLDTKKSDYLAGIFGALGLLVWHIQIFYFTLWILFVLILTFKDRKNITQIKAVLLSTIRIFLTPIIVVTIVRLVSPITTEQSILRFDFFSFFQPLYLILLLLPYVYFYLFLTARSKKTFIWYSFVFFAFLLVALFMFTPIISAVKEIKVFLAKSEPYLTNIQEYRPKFEKIHFIYKGFITIKNYSFFLFFLVPVVYSLFYLIKILKKKTLDKHDIVSLPCLLLIFSTGVLQFYQNRWGNEASFGIAFSHGTLLYLLWKYGNRFKYNYLFSTFFVSVYIVITLLSAIIGTKDLILKRLDPMDYDAYITIKWIKENTPKTSYYLEPYKKPEYGVMTPWDMGHLVIYYAERPVPASNFGHSLRGTGFKDSYAVWQVKEGKELTEICKRNEIKYLLIKDPIGYMTGLEKEKVYYYFPAMRLMQFDGGFSAFGPALENFRLIYESYNRSTTYYNVSDVRKYKIFEFVKGARISGKTFPLNDVNIFTTFKSDKNREFKWSLRTFADEKGYFSCVVPYATKNVQYTVKAVQPFKAISKNKVVEFDIDEADIHVGKEIKINFN